MGPGTLYGKLYGWSYNNPAKMLRRRIYISARTHTHNHGNYRTRKKINL